MPPISDDALTIDFNEAQLAAAFDQVIDARQAGKNVDRASLIARFPQLAQALDALEQLCRPTVPGDGDAATRSIAVPLQISHYRIESEIGSGGFGVVYKAFDATLKRPVALKVLHSGRLNQAEAVERFLREARATAKLQHS